MTDWNAYDGFLEEAERDTRIGEHNAVVDSVEEKTWPSGDKFTRIVFMLITADMAKADLTLNPCPAPEEIEAQKAGWDHGRKRGVAQTIRLHRELAQHYDIADPAAIQRGMTFRVKTAKTKINQDTGKGGFIRVVAILPAEGEIKPPSMPGF